MLIILGIIFVSNFFCDVTASTIDDVKQEYMNIITTCMDENPLSPLDIDGIQTNPISETPALKCLFACAFKRTGMMDDKGKLSVQGVLEATKKYFPDDLTIVKTSEDFANACSGVNDVPVSDGEKGCERAALLYKCSLEKSPDFHLF